MSGSSSSESYRTSNGRPDEFPPIMCPGGLSHRNELLFIDVHAEEKTTRIYGTTARIFFQYATFVPPAGLLAMTRTRERSKPSEQSK